MSKRTCGAFLILVALLTGGCKKEFLNKVPSTALVVPSTLADYQKLLDNTYVFGYTPVMAEVSADNLILSATFWPTLDPAERNAYTWSADIYEGQGLIDDWDIPYRQVFYANVILEGLKVLPVTTANQAQWTAEQGSALFLRAYAFHQLAGVFAPPYDSTTAATDLGIPLRLQSDVTAPSVRASVAATYEQITSDLRQARILLPANVASKNPNRPSQPAALALLARVYLSMRAYELAGRYADSALQRYDALMDYNSIDTTNLFPFEATNAEVLYQSNVVTSTQCMAALIYPGMLVDSLLYRSYGSEDLRSPLFYTLNPDSGANIRPGYASLIWPFTGLATDELYLIRAECEARAGQLVNALADLNTLLQHRYATGTFTPVTAGTATQALDLILAERRKELAFRGLRWSDLRRLNKEGRNIVLSRTLGNQSYQLLPNSNRYTLPIPPDVLKFNPSMPQNPR